MLSYLEGPPVVVGGVETATDAVDGEEEEREEVGDGESGQVGVRRLGEASTRQQHNQVEDVQKHTDGGDARHDDRVPDTLGRANPLN